MVSKRDTKTLKMYCNNSNIAFNTVRKDPKIVKMDSKLVKIVSKKVKIDSKPVKIASKLVKWHLN